MKTKLMRMLAMVLMVAMLMMNACCFAETEEESGIVYVDPTYLNGAEIEPDQWVLLDSTREYFFLYMLLDCLNVWDDTAQTTTIEALVADRVYMIEDGSSLGIFAFGNVDIYMFLYDTVGQVACYQMLTLEDISPDMCETLLTMMKGQGTFNEFYKIDSANVMATLDQLLGE